MVVVDCKIGLDLLKKKLNKMVVEQGIDASEVLAFSQVVDKAILEYYKNIFSVESQEKRIGGF